jgi:hypothetical protein
MSQVKKSPVKPKVSPVLRKSPLKVAAKVNKVTHKKATPKKAVKKATPKKKAVVKGKAVKAKGTPKKRVSRKSNAPKRPMSAFFLYMKENRENIKRDNPTAEFLDIPRIGAEQWKALKPSAKTKYEAMADREKQRYATEMSTYVPSPEDKKKKRKKKDPNAPKRPSSAYICYVNSRLDRLRKEQPQLKMPEVMTALGAEWRGLDARSKRPFEESAAKDKVRYQNESAKYNAK